MNIWSLAVLITISVLLIVYYNVPKKHRWIVLLAGSLGFFIWNCKTAVFHLLTATLTVYLSALYMEKTDELYAIKKRDLSKEERKKLKAEYKQKKRNVLWVACLTVFIFLIVLKYSGLFTIAINRELSFFGIKTQLPFLKFVLPLGISYYTLMAVSYITDVYRGVIVPEKNPLRLLLFLCYFPHITEGPFDTYSELAPQFNNTEPFSYDNFMNSVCLMLTGLIKKLVIADRLSFISNEMFSNSGNYEGLSTFIGMAAYMFSLYMDFSGVIDMFRAISQMFGIKLAENFNRPFFSRSVLSFWRNWHISFGAWMRNYIFYPVSISAPAKKLTKKLYKNQKPSFLSNFFATTFPMLFVWLFMGIWHGASFKYVAYGLYFFVVISIGSLLEPIINKFFVKTSLNRKSKFFRVINTLRTVFLVLIGITLFRADTFSHFTSIIASLAHFNFNVSGLFAKCSDLIVWDYVIAILFYLAFIIKERFEIAGKYFDKWVCEKDFRRFIFILAGFTIVILLGIYGSGYTEQISVYADF